MLSSARLHDHGRMGLAETVWRSGSTQKARLFDEDLYGAASWEKKRRVIYKVEAMEQ
jgi:hypothetical protein